MDKTLLKFKFESAKRKAAEVAGKGIELAKAGIEYTKENKEIIIPIVIGGTTIAKKMAKEHSAKQEEKNRLTRYYDPRRGKYTHTKRIPTNREALEIERRYDAGESYRSILSDMGLARR